MSNAVLLEDSWKRSHSFGVNRTKPEAAILESYELNQYREQKKELLQAINPMVKRLYNWVQTSKSMIIVADKPGYILESYGDPTFVSDADKVHLMQGACWSEEVRGTNAIGTVITEKKSLSVVGSDHFCTANHMLCCAASPIFNPSGELIAVLDVSGYREVYHPSILMMVDMMASTIEDWILLNKKDQQMVIALSSENDKEHRALIALDKDGIVIGGNREAFHLLRIDPLYLKKLSIENLLNGITPLIQQNRTGSNQEFHTVHKIDNENERWIASVLKDTRPTFIPLTNVDVNSVPKSIPKKTGNHRYTFADILGRDKKLESVLELAQRAAQTDFNIMIHGESGTGKEMFSQAIHEASQRSKSPFVAINCGAIAKTLMESELFGYEAGAFTGAKKTDHPGKVEQANGGTLFLDEIAEMPLDMQVALLRILQERTVVRIGGTKSIPVDIRVIAATHKNLWQEVQENRFRADLFFRLQGIQLNLPPLREREDRVELAEHLLKGIAWELGKEKLLFTPEASNLIKRYPWPGNVRELAAALRQAAFLCCGYPINVSHFPTYILENYIPGNQLSQTEIEFHEQTNQRMNKQETDHSELSGFIETNHFPNQSLEKIEQDVILETLKKTDGNVAHAAKLLGIGRNTLYRKMRKLGLH